MISGNLFTRDYLLEGIKRTPQWAAISDADLIGFREKLLKHAQRLTAGARPNEAQTEKTFIYPVLEDLGWADVEVQQTLSQRGRKQVPDAILFPDRAARDRAVAEADQWRRYHHGLAVLEAKRWLRQLDRADKKDADEEGVPSTQMMQYLSRVDVQTSGKVRLGILTNGEKWRLYFQGALSVSDDYFELNLAKALDLPGHPLDLFDQGDARLTRDHCLKLFYLIFGKQAFLPVDGTRTFHDISREAGRIWEEKVTKDLSVLVFEQLYPMLVSALAKHDPNRPKPITDAYLSDVQESALVLLYRLLFVVYAEDRDLLPDRQEPYKSYSLTVMRLEIADRIARGQVFSPTQHTFWPKLTSVFTAIADGDDTLGIPPYNGGLFAKETAPLLARVQLPDTVVAQLVFNLSHRPDDDTGEPRYINYRDLTVQQLGTIYERTLEYGLKADGDEVGVDPDDAARHQSGSYYTPDSLVSLIIERAVGPFVEERRVLFREKAAALAKDTRHEEIRLAELQGFDPALGILELKICDPAMGSGHFLVNLVDWLADKALAAIGEAESLVDWSDKPYRSPVLANIEQTRIEIIRQATLKKWPFVVEHLDDRHIVRRTILKRCIYGVDKNPMAVELAKVALWLHTFTVGAPLSFLDHHLRCGNSLFGFWVKAGMDRLTKWGGQLLINEPLQNAMGQAVAMAKLEKVNDIDIGEVHQSKTLFDGIEQETRPLNSFLHVLYALDWQKLDKAQKGLVKAWLDGQFGDPIDIARGKALLGPGDEGTGYPQAKDVLGRIPANMREDAVRFVPILNAARRTNRAQRFHNWQVAFPGVWQDWPAVVPKGGFDAVIGNPPYVRQELITDIKPALKRAFPNTYDGSADLYVFFYDQGLQLLKPGGRLSYTVTNKWMRGGYAENLRAQFADKAWIEFVADFGHAKHFFPDADVHPSVVCIRNPDGSPAPSDTEVCVIPRDEVPEKRLDEAVVSRKYNFPLPRTALGRDNWVLERPDVLALLDKVRTHGTPLKEYLDTDLYYGIKTGLNEAFLITGEKRDHLVRDDPSCETLIKPYMRGQDVRRWFSPATGLYMIELKSSSDYAWPWANAETPADAEEVFRRTYPSLYAHLKPLEEFKDAKGKVRGLRHREDQGRYWWELRPCAYYDAFAQPKLIYQVIQFHPRYSLDTEGRLSNDKTFFLPTDDRCLLAVLNSPILWWFNWRHLTHLKDEALSPMGYKMEQVPIAPFTGAARRKVVAAVDGLIQATAIRQETAAAIADWLRLELQLEKWKTALNDPSALDADSFCAAIRESLPRRTELTAADIKRFKGEYAATVKPAAKARERALQLEQELSALVNEAYGLTDADVDLMWRTAPPRMPYNPQGGLIDDDAATEENE